MTPSIDIRPERPEDAAVIEAVVAGAFGPGRLAKTAERLRERGRFRPDLSFTAWSDERLFGTVRLWSVRVGEQPVVFLGPIAVERRRRGGGVGARLVQAALDASATAGETAVLLVGDTSFFAPLGFSLAYGIILPGPVDPSRILINALAGAPPRGQVR